MRRPNVHELQPYKANIKFGDRTGKKTTFKYKGSDMMQKLDSLGESVIATEHNETSSGVALDSDIDLENES